MQFGVGAIQFDPHLDVLLSNWSFVTSYDQHGVLRKDEHYLNTWPIRQHNKAIFKEIPSKSTFYWRKLNHGSLGLPP